MKKVIIIGAGISGLATAWWLHKKFPNIEIFVIEKESHIGGNVCLKQHENFHFDVGPKGFLTQDEGVFTLKLIQELGLDKHLIFSSTNAKTRFIHYNNQTHAINLWTLIKNGLISSCCKDLFSSRYTDDSSVAEFLKRHCSKKFIQHILNPFVLATRAAHSHLLSTHMAFPSLAKQESIKGSLLLHFLRKTKMFSKNGPHSHNLATLAPHLYVLIETLQKKLPVTWLLPQQVIHIQSFDTGVQVTTKDTVISADLVIYTGPIAALPSMLNHSRITNLAKTIYPFHLSNISLAWKAKIPLPNGYGILFADEPPLFGIMFPSQIFPTLHQKQTSISLLIDGFWHEETAYAYALSALSRYLHIFNPPDAYTVFSPPDGLPQHSVNFMKLWPHVKASLPKNIKIVGQNIAGPGLNHCIASAFRAVHTLNAIE